MENKDFKTILQNALEQEVPASQIGLWTGIRERLVAGRKPSFEQGEKMKPIGSRRLQRLALVMLMIVALMAVVLITPQGRAFAQDIFKFFKRADSNVMPISPDLVASVEEAQTIPTVVPPAPLITVSDAYQVVGFSFL